MSETPGSKTPGKTTDDSDVVGGMSDDELRAEGIRALRAERENNRNLKAELAELKKTLQDKDDEGLKDAEKWQKKFNDADAKLKDYESKAALDKVKTDIAKTAGVPVDLLAGDSEEALKAHAELLAQHLGPQKPAPNEFLGTESQGADSAEQNAMQVLGF